MLSSVDLIRACKGHGFEPRSSIVLSGFLRLKNYLHNICHIQGLVGFWLSGEIRKRRAFLSSTTAEKFTSERTASLSSILKKVKTWGSLRPSVINNSFLLIMRELRRGKTLQKRFLKELKARCQKSDESELKQKNAI